MKKLLLSIMALFAVVAANADTRSWDFTKGSNYSSLSSDANFTLLSKGRYSNTNALNEEAFVMSDGTEFPMSAGLKFTAAAQKIMFGLTANYFFQTNGTVSLIIPDVTKGDTIVINWCSGSSGATKTITGNISPDVSTSSTSKVTTTTYATADGDLALSMATTTRIYSLTVKPYIAAKEGECKAPTATQVGIDVTAKSWKYQINEGEADEVLTYTIDGGTATSVNSGDIILVAPGKVVVVNATKGENKGETKFTTPEFTKSEKVAAPAAKSTEIVGLSYTIPALDNAGAGNGYNVKWRTNQEGNTTTIKANEGFVITKVIIKGKNNFDDGDITLKSFIVDGGESLSGDEFVVFDKEKTEQTITFTGVSRDSIVLTYGDVQGSANQFNADITVEWAFADEDPETDNSVTFAYKGVPTAISDVTTSVVKNGKVVENGKVVILNNGSKYTVAGQLIK